MVEVYLNTNPSRTMIVDELSDWLFAEGWRYSQQVNQYDVLEFEETRRQLGIMQHGY